MPVSRRQAQINANAITLDKQFAGLNRGRIGGGWGGDYIRYMAFHPNLDPNEVFYAVETALRNAELGLAAIPKTIGEAVGAVGKGTGQIVKGTGEGLKFANPLQFLSLLTSRNLWFRVAEVTIGGTLVAVAVAHIFSNTETGKAAISVAKFIK